MLIRVKLLIAIFGVLFVMLGCNSENSLSKPQHASTHLKSSSKMRTLMQELRTVVNEHHKSELERDDDRRRYALKLSNKTVDMSHQLREFSKYSRMEQLKDSKKKRYFLKITDELEAHGQKIGRVSKEYKLEELDNAIFNLKISCNRCHKIFNASKQKI